jgi:hypothetical protein
MLPAIGVMSVQPSTHRCRVIADVPAHAVGRQPDPHVPPLIQRAEGHTEELPASPGRRRLGYNSQEVANSEATERSDRQVRLDRADDRRIVGLGLGTEALHLA